MGRSKSNSKVKSTTPIPLPHDGTVHSHLINGSSNDGLSTSSKPSPSLSVALHLLELSSQSEGVDSTLLLSEEARLCKILVEASTAQEQLQALQSHRIQLSSLLKRQQNEQKKQEWYLKEVEKQIYEDMTEIESPDAPNEWIGLYRILLEWSLSTQTTVPLRRAIQSNLSAYQNLQLDSKAVRSVQREVLVSFWNNPCATISAKRLMQVAQPVGTDGGDSKVLTIDDDSKCDWNNALYSMEMAVNYEPTLQLLRENLASDAVSFLFRHWVSPFLTSDVSNLGSINNTSDSTMVKDGLVIAEILKILLQPTKSTTGMGVSPELLQATEGKSSSSSTIPKPSKTSGRISSGLTVIPHLTDFRIFFLRILTNSNTPPEGYNVLGLAYGRCLLIGSNGSPNDPARKAIDTIQALQNDRGTNVLYRNLSQLAKLHIVQGIGATLDAEDLIRQPLVSNETDGKSDGTELQSSKTSPLDACWMFSMLINREATDPLVRLGIIKCVSTLVSRCQSLEKKMTGQLIEETLEMVLQAWESPPLRRLGKQIPKLFDSIVQLLDDGRVEDLVHSILVEQPVHRKGRYIALETLLPRIGAQKILQHGGLESLLEGIGDRGGQNTGVIADLWAKILQYLWKECVGQLNERDTDKFSTPASDDNPIDDQINDVFANWLEQWIPSLAWALVEPSGFSRRKQVASFCLPRMLSLMKESGDKILLARIPDAAGSLLDVIRKRHPEPLELANDGNEEQTFGDRTMWALLEVIRKTSVNILDSRRLKEAISYAAPEHMLRGALTHTFVPIRLVAFQSLEPIVLSYDRSILSVEQEVELWKFAFPYAARNTESREYTSSLLQCLSCFIDRFLTAEAKIVQSSPPTEVGDASLEEISPDTPARLLLPRVSSFIQEFLIWDIIIKRGAYPGTIGDKEGFTIALLECVLAFATQNQSFASDLLTKNAVIFKRRRREVEVDTMAQVIDALLNRNVFAALFGFLHSQWDLTRKSAFRFLTKLVAVSQTRSLRLPPEYTLEENRSIMRTRAFCLASSPRQREADTGARIIAFLYISSPTADGRADFMEELADLLEVLITSMKDKLSMLLSLDREKSMQSTTLDDGKDLPLAHGIIQAIRLNIEWAAATGIIDSLYKRMTSVFCRALQVSLSVVADVKDGEILEGMDSDLNLETELSCDTNLPSTPLNVNTGAIGANGLFSSLKARNRDESERRLAVQRVVVGSWLLTKETCAAIAAIITADGFKAPHLLVEQVGMLLISTLTSLKHAGAAFAAHNALQQIASACLSQHLESGTHAIPAIWVKRLLEEMSVSDKVRDSTLRRSTGYALGFLAIMRSEVVARSGPTKLCSSILANILRLSLPSNSGVQEAFDELGMDSRSVLTHTMQSEWISCNIANAEYQERSRVHALNVLRLIILDAPLAQEVGPIVGDAIVSSILGYIDPAWSVRNSSTMVFSAAMLRVVDADKNASNTDRTSNNAITVTELNRRYPCLLRFLQSVMKADLVKLTSHGGTVDSQVFPILLLLSRVQSVFQSGLKAAEQTEAFVPLVFEYLKHRNESIRSAAARAISNLCSSDQMRNSSIVPLLERCFNALPRELAESTPPDFNAVHGYLLAINELTSTSSMAMQHVLDSRASQKLLDITTWAKTSLPQYPPCCIIPALSTLLRCVSDKTSDLRVRVEAVCLNIVSKLESSQTIGAAKLGATTAAVWCSLALPSLWDTNFCCETSNARLSQLSYMLGSSLIDVRLAAVKAFKKAIYSSIDKFVATGISLQRKIDKLASIGGMLLEVLHKELRRDEQANDQTHPPTLRRLSRCFLECADAFKRVDVGGGQLFGEVLQHSDLLWKVSCMMSERENATLENFEPTGETLLMANAAEMMSINIATNVKSMASGEPDPHLPARMIFFSSGITRLNDPQYSWRSRHSAALAIENSQILRWGLGDLRLQETQHLMVFETLQMLQDGDPDVRKVAGRIASSLLRNGDGFISPSALPHLILELSFSSILTRDGGFNSGELSRYLIKSITGYCEAAPRAITLLLDEVSYYSATRPLSSLKVTTSRKIFEDEDLNPTDERLLTNQLSLRFLLQSAAHMPLNTLYGDILTLCHSCLIHLRNSLGQNDEAAREVTRFPTVFPMLHTLIIAGAVALYTGAPDPEEVQETTRTIVAGISRNGNASWNPEIISALTTLGSVRKSNEKSFASISANCFLLNQ